MTAPTSPLTRFLRFLGKVQFTTGLLLGGAAIMTLGTIIESRGSREIAWSAIYGTVWFDLFLFLIGVNLVIAVINRIPIRRHQWPFVVTHVAIVVLLAGAWISQTYGYEGRLVVYEGEEENRLLMDASEIRVRWLGGADPSGGGEVAFPVPRSGRIAGRTLQRGGPRGARHPNRRVPPRRYRSRSELREGATNESPGHRVPPHRRAATRPSVVDRRRPPVRPKRPRPRRGRVPTGASRRAARGSLRRRGEHRHERARLAGRGWRAGSHLSSRARRRGDSVRFRRGSPRARALPARPGGGRKAERTRFRRDQSCSGRGDPGGESERGAYRLQPLPRLQHGGRS